MSKPVTGERGRPIFRFQNLLYSSNDTLQQRPQYVKCVEVVYARVLEQPLQPQLESRESVCVQWLQLASHLCRHNEWPQLCSQPHGPDRPSKMRFVCVENKNDLVRVSIWR